MSPYRDIIGERNACYASRASTLINMKLYAVVMSDKGGSDAKKGGNTLIQVYLYRGNKKVAYITLTKKDISFTEYPQQSKKQKSQRRKGNK